MFENATFDVSCPKCGYKMQIQAKSVGSVVHCPTCGQCINLQDSGFKDGMKSAEQSIENFKKDISKMFK